LCSQQIVNGLGGATASQALALAAQAQASVQQRFGVWLEQEPVVFA